jgi:uncharacterized membrane protein
VSSYVLVRLAHILLAAIVIGATVSYAFWIGLAERAPEHLAFTIRAVRRSDRFVAIPAYLLLFVSGVGMMWLGPVPLDRPWLLASIALYVVTLVVGFVLFGPTVRRELAALERGGVADPEYLRRRGEARLLTGFTILALVAVLALMVLRPF